MENPFNIILERISGLEDLIKSMSSNQPQIQASPEELVSHREICHFLNLSTTTVRKRRNNGDIPHKRIGKKYLYSKSEVSEAIKKKRGGIR
ncbi:helix-turn-helix domain-containing protein [Daejeonella sp. H1SJ63]|uniref:helix-turn-helix domain-containing protein n=1 Tax=Daejeonella sp. H1SJ63 TaxID=3034145 RepID=UPI0023ED086B|nr:helix-turn-helix domain-containing protein [Daejeonella sp. H1SJ63]